MRQSAADRAHAFQTAAAEEAISRRSFLSQGLSTAAGLSAAMTGAAGLLAGLDQSFSARSVQAADKKETAVTAAPLPIVDTHQHLWDLSLFSQPWNKDNPKLTKSFVTSDYLAASKGLNVVQSVYMEVDVEEAQQTKEARYVIDLCERNDNPMVAAVISGRPASDGFAAYLDQFKGSPYIKGVRQVLHGESTPKGFCLQPGFIRGMQQLGERGLSYDLCMRSDDLVDGYELAKQCKQTRFIVDHCGNMDVQEQDPAKRQRWKDGMQKLAQLDNVVCKVSGIIASAKADWKPADLASIINDTLKTFGPDRVMFASDWPVCTLAATFSQWVNCLKELVQDRPLAEQKKLFHDNAVAFYKLPQKKWSAKTS